MPLQLISRLSFRHRRNQENAEKNMTQTMRKASSCKGLQRGERVQEDKPRLPEDLLLRIVDHCDAIEQIRMRAVCKTVKNHVDRKLKKITRLNVEKRDIDTASGKGWARHRHAQVSLKMRMNTAKIVVDSRWTSRDVSTVVGAMSVYRKTILEATIDAPIAELLVVSLSALDLNRWYAFQCYMKAMDVFDEDMHMDCDFVNPGEVYWPHIQHLTVRTTEQQAPHLARVIDYGVQCNWVLDRRNLCRLRIIFTDLDATPSRKVSRHLYHFRCWAGSAGFDHRYEQQFGAAKAQSVMI
ncbi:F-box domain protein [Ancylostoma caninum]|uniref:F-box domain protein n=1 Tax=Ancylostoma caninum TaxID=29170 RepID=A0A368G6H7_ANCCA|nr:F-box domain protein [Ancylostoma caninum]RCN39288.1 F-box domain protein [Ancylostoma caninum]